MRLNDKVIIITGSTTGIGQAIARQCAAEGASVLIHGRDPQRAKAVAASLPGEAACCIEDLADPDSPDRIVRATMDAFGKVDGLVNNAAWMLAEQGAQADQALTYIEQAIDFHGPNLQLLDTRGMVLLFQRSAARAVEDLARVVGEKGAEAQHQFHYALALAETGEIDEARVWLEKARSEGLSQDQLTPVERGMLDELEIALGT